MAINCLLRLTLLPLDYASVLTLAWHRLYLRGVPKTYNIRLRVLNYISLYVHCWHTATLMLGMI